MSRRAAAVLTVIAFTVFSTGCMTWRNKEIRTSVDYPRPNKGIAGVVLRSGEAVEFSRQAPARVVGDRVVGTVDAVREREVEIEGPFPLIDRNADGAVIRVTGAGGKVWVVREVLSEGPNRMTVRVAERVTGPVSIPLSDILRIKIKRTNTALTALAALGGTAAALFGTFVVLWKIDQSRH